MNQLWFDLDRAIHGPDLEILRAMSWDSSKPEVQRAWRAITDE